MDDYKVVEVSIRDWQLLVLVVGYTAAVSFGTYIVLDVMGRIV